MFKTTLHYIVQFSGEKCCFSKPREISRKGLDSNMGGRFIERFIFSAEESVDFSHLTTWKEKKEVEEEVEEAVRSVEEGQRTSELPSVPRRHGSTRGVIRWVKRVEN